MDIRKDQLKFDKLIKAPNLPINGAVSPLNMGLEDAPQKTHPQISTGPKFNFIATNVTEAENALRIVAANLKVSLEESIELTAGQIQYREIQANLAKQIPELYRAYDQYVAAVLSTGEEKISCSKTCSHCCSHYVTSVEPYELLFLHSRIRDDARYPSRVIALHRRASLFNSLQGSGRDDAAEDRKLYRYFLRGMPCPFLGAGGICGVYESRPMSCRMFYSLSHPSLCKGKSVIAPGNRNFLIELPDDIEADLARAGNLFAELSLPESLFEGLLKVNELFGQFDLEPDISPD